MTSVQMPDNPNVTPTFREGWRLAERELADATPAVRQATYRAWEEQAKHRSAQRDCSQGDQLAQALSGAMAYVVALNTAEWNQAGRDAIARSASRFD